MSTLLQHIDRWFRGRERGELPTLDVPDAVVTDDDVDAWSDMRYLQDLADEITHLAYCTPGSACQAELILARPTIDDQDIALDWPSDQAAVLLAAWRMGAVL